MTSAFLQKLAARCDRLTGSLPTLAGGLEPLAAIYPKRCHAFASEALTKSRRSARDFASACRAERAVRLVPVTGAEAGCFANWNRPADMRPSD